MADDAPLDHIVKPKLFGNHTDRRNRSGRVAGARNMRTRAMDELMAQTGLDAPHVALFKIGHDDKVELPLRIQALAAASPYFAPRYSPTLPPRFAPEALNLGQLTDEASAVAFVARIAEQVQAGKLDATWAQFFASLASLFADLHRKAQTEIEVERHRELTLAAE
jgi:hypothetical protein